MSFAERLSVWRVRRTRLDCAADGGSQDPPSIADSFVIVMRCSPAWFPHARADWLFGGYMGASGTSSNTLTVTPAAGAPFSLPDVAYKGQAFRSPWYYGVRVGWLPAATKGFGARGRVDARESHRADRSARFDLNAFQQSHGLNFLLGNRRVSVLARLRRPVHGGRPRRRRHLDASRRVNVPQRAPGAVSVRRVRVAGRARGASITSLAVRLRHRRRAHHAREREASPRAPAPRLRAASSRGTSILASAPLLSSLLAVTVNACHTLETSTRRLRRLASLPCLSAREPSRPRAQSVASLFTTLPADFAHLFTPANGIIVGIGGARQRRHSSEGRRDRRRRFARHRARGTISSGRARRIGDGAEQSGFALGIYIVGRCVAQRAHRRARRRPGRRADRQWRSDAGTEDRGRIARRPNGASIRFRPAIPPRHSRPRRCIARALTAGRLRAPFYALGGYVSVSRMVDNKHWASDVIFGAALGIVSGRAASFGHGLERVSVAVRLCFRAASPSSGRIGGSEDQPLRRRRRSALERS